MRAAVAAAVLAALLTLAPAVPAGADSTTIFRTPDADQHPGENWLLGETASILVGGAAITANLWVNTTPGGTPARCAAACAYDATKAYGTLDAAYDAASCGDTVYIKAGTYPTQPTINGARTCSGWASYSCSGCVNILAAPSESVTIQEMDFDTSAWIRIGGFTVVPKATGVNPNNELFGMKNVHEILVDNVTVDGRFGGTAQSRDLFDINGNTNNVTVQNSDVGYNLDAKSFKVQTCCAALVQNTNVKLDHNKFHDNTQSGPAAHLECMWLEGFSSLEVTRNTFYDCSLNIEVAQDADTGAFNGMLFSQNVFEAADKGVGGAGKDFDGSCTQMQAQGVSNWVFEYNRWWNGDFMAGCTFGAQVTYRGNIGSTGDFNCMTGATYRYNVWQAKQCATGATGDVLNSTINDASQYVAAKASGVFGIGDYHYASCASGMIGKGDPTLFPATDADRSSRPVSVVDAGPYERAGC